MLKANFLSRFWIKHSLTGHGKPSFIWVDDYNMTRHWICCKLISGKTLKLTMLGRFTPLRRKRKCFQWSMWKSRGGPAVPESGKMVGSVLNAGVGRRGGASSSFFPFILIATKYYKLKSEREKLKVFLAKSKCFDIHLKFYLSFKSLCKSFHVHHTCQKNMTQKKEKY